MIQPEGKGVFIWRLERCAGGDMAALADQLFAAGITWVAVKAGEGFLPFNDALLPAFLSAARSREIEVWGWHYVYGATTTTGAPQADKEALVARTQMSKYQFAGWIVDAEGEYKRPGSAVWAETYMSTIRTYYPTLTLALCSYRYPAVHPELPWATFLRFADLHMPQVYWKLAHNPAEQLTKSIGQLKALKDIPIIPVGAAFAESGWRPTVEEINEFDAAVHLQNLSGLSWWVWDGGIDIYPEYLTAITAHRWGNPLAELLAQVNDLTDRVTTLETMLQEYNAYFQENQKYFDEKLKSAEALNMHLNGRIDSIVSEISRIYQHFEGLHNHQEGRIDALVSEISNLVVHVDAADEQLATRVRSNEIALDLTASIAAENKIQLAKLVTWAKSIAYNPDVP